MLDRQRPNIRMHAYGFRLLQTYDKLCEKLKDLSALQGISGLLGWDEAS